MASEGFALRGEDGITLYDRKGHKVAVRYRKTLWVLAVLAEASPRRVTREALAVRCWPDLDSARARANLRIVLTELRSLIGEHLSSTRSHVGIHPSWGRVDWGSPGLLDEFEDRMPFHKPVLSEIHPVLAAIRHMAASDPRRAGDLVLCCDSSLETMSLNHVVTVLAEVEDALVQNGESHFGLTVHAHYFRECAGQDHPAATRLEAWKTEAHLRNDYRSAYRCALMQGDRAISLCQYQAACNHFQEALHIARAQGDHYLEGWSLVNRSVAEFHAGWINQGLLTSRQAQSHLQRTRQKSLMDVALLLELQALDFMTPADQAKSMKMVLATAEFSQGRYTTFFEQVQALSLIRSGDATGALDITRRIAAHLRASGDAPGAILIDLAALCLAAHGQHDLAFQAVAYGNGRRGARRRSSLEQARMMPLMQWSEANKDQRDVVRFSQQPLTATSFFQALA